MARAAWTGIISLGLMNLPAQLVPLRKAEQDQSIEAQRKRFDEERSQSNESLNVGLRKLGGTKYFLSQSCPTSVPAPEPGVVSLITALESSDINAVAYADEFLIVPTDGALHAFVLFMDMLDKHKRVEIGAIELRRAGHLCAIVPKDGVLTLNTLSPIADISTDAAFVKHHISTCLLDLMKKFERGASRNRGKLKKAG